MKEVGINLADASHDPMGFIVWEGGEDKSLTAHLPPRRNAFPRLGVRNFHNLLVVKITITDRHTTE